MTYLIFLLSLWSSSTAHAQSVVIDKPAPVVQVEVIESNPDKVQLAVVRPANGQVFTDSMVHIDGTATNLRAGDFVLVHLGDLEQFVPVDEQGQFSTTAFLHAIGPYSLVVSAGAARRKVDFVYQPLLSKLAVTPIDRPVIFPGDTFPLEAIGHFKNGLKQIVDSYASWQSSNPQVGRVDREGRFTAVSPGHTVVSAIYNGTRTDIPIDVVESDPPPASDGLSNVVVRNSQVILRVFDHAAEDGDFLSIYLNDGLVAESIEIFHAPQDFPVMLKPGVNKIEIVALNEGREPPNTATLVVLSSNGEWEQDFKADQQASGHFFITLH